MERDLIENKLEESYNFIRSQNSIKKDQRDLKGMEKARRVRDTMEKWINADDAIKAPRPVKRPPLDDLFITIGNAIIAGQNFNISAINQTMGMFNDAIDRERIRPRLREMK